MSRLREKWPEISVTVIVLLQMIDVIRGATW